MERFWPKVIKTESCWNWNAFINKRGYGIFNYKGKPVLAHRVSYILCVKPLLPKQRILHSCKNPLCVNPYHLVVETDYNRFWDKVFKSESCWEWMGNKIKDGYGRFKINGKLMLSHRVSYEMHYGIIPNGMDVLHHCDNPSCVRPDHLFLGNDYINQQDCISKGRHITPNKKLNKTQVKFIREAQYNTKKLSALFNVTHTTIYDIQKRKTWKNV